MTIHEQRSESGDFHITDGSDKTRTIAVAKATMAQSATADNLRSCEDLLDSGLDIYCKNIQTGP